MASPRWHKKSAFLSIWTGNRLTYTVEALRAFGSSELKLRTADGATFEGHVVGPSLSDAAAVLLFAVSGDPNEPLIVPLETIVSIVTIGER